MAGAVQEDKRIRRTKKLLRQALTRLMQQKDFPSITVTDVVREADINRGTFYAHYRDVYDLRDKIEAEMIGDFRDLIADIQPRETSTLEPVLTRAMDYLEENREIVTALVRGTGVEGSPYWRSAGSKCCPTAQSRIPTRPASCPLASWACSKSGSPTRSLSRKPR